MKGSALALSGIEFGGQLWLSAFCFGIKVDNPYSLC